MSVRLIEKAKMESNNAPNHVSSGEMSCVFLVRCILSVSLPTAGQGSGLGEDKCLFSALVTSLFLQSLSEESVFHSEHMWVFFFQNDIPRGKRHDSVSGTHLSLMFFCTLPWSLTMYAGTYTSVPGRMYRSVPGCGPAGPPSRRFL